MIERTVNIAQNHEAARKWDIQQVTEMSHEERQKIAKILKERVYGENPVDVRAYHRETRKK